MAEHYPAKRRAAEKKSWKYKGEGAVAGQVHGKGAGMSVTALKKIKALVLSSNLFPIAKIVSKSSAFPY